MYSFVLVYEALVQVQVYIVYWWYSFVLFLAFYTSTYDMESSVRNNFGLSHAQVQVKNVSRLCHAKPIVTVNGMFPGPTVYAREGDQLLINVTNHAQYNMSIHWYLSCFYIYNPSLPSFQNRVFDFYSCCPKWETCLIFHSFLHVKHIYTHRYITRVHVIFWAGMDWNNTAMGGQMDQHI